MLLNESPSGAGIVPMHCTIRQVLRRSIRLIANAIPLPMILRRSFRFPNDRFGIMTNEPRRVTLGPPWWVWARMGKAGGMRRERGRLYATADKATTVPALHQADGIG